MLTAFPSLTPRDAHSLFYRPQSTFGSDVPTEFEDNAAAQQGTNGLLQNRGQGREAGSNRRVNASSVPTVLQQLNMDEDSIRIRKKNIQLFGATWIRPPGLTRTLQQEMDEHAEHEEHMQMEETVEEGMTTAEVDPNVAANNNAGAIVAPTEEGEEVGDEETNEIDEGDPLDLEEEDLDAEIPEGSETWSNDDDDEEEEEEEEEEEDEDGEEGNETVADEEGEVSGYVDEEDEYDEEDDRAPGDLPNDSFNAEYGAMENPSTPGGVYTSPSQQLQRHFHQRSMRHYGSSPFSFADVTTQSSEGDLEEDDEMELDQGQ